MNGSYGKAVSGIRTKLELSQRALGLICDVSQGEVCRWENDEAVPSIHKSKQIIDFLMEKVKNMEFVHTIGIIRARQRDDDKFVESFKKAIHNVITFNGFDCVQFELINPFKLK